MENAIYTLIPIVLFLCLAAICIAPIAISSFYKNRERQRLHETLRLMVEKGQPISGDVLESLKASVKTRNPPSDMRRGVMLMAIAFALAGFGLALGLTDDNDACGPLIGIAAFPGFVGLGYVVLAIIARNRPRV